MPYKAILFDLDGTLLDTLADLADSTNAALAEMGLPQHPLEAYKLFVGDGLEVLAGGLWVRGPTIQPKWPAASCWRGKRMPVAGPIRAALILASPICSMGLPARNPDGRLLEQARRVHATVRDAAAGGVAFRRRSRRDAGASREARSQRGAGRRRALGVAPAEILYLGDTNTDMRTAVAAGMYPVGALWGFRTAEECATPGPPCWQRCRWTS